MKNNSKKKINPVSVILYIISAAFFIYGVYMVIYSVIYVQSYGGDSVTTENALQYIVTSVMAYFGFCGVFFTGAYIIQELTNIKPALSTDNNTPIPEMKEIIIEKPQTQDTKEKITEKENISEKNHMTAEENITDEQEKIIETPSDTLNNNNQMQEESNSVNNTSGEKISSSMIKNIFEDKK